MKPEAKRGPGASTIPGLRDCIAYIESCGWTYSHRSVIRTYVFDRKPGLNPWAGRTQIAFTLTELRDAIKHGW